MNAPSEPLDHAQGCFSRTLLYCMYLLQKRCIVLKSTVPARVAKCSTSLRVTFSNPQNYVNYGFFNLQTKPLLFCNSGSSLLYYQRLYTEPPLHPNSSLVCSTAVAIDLLLLFFIKNNISRFSSKRWRSGFSKFTGRTNYLSYLMGWNWWMLGL